MEAFVYQHIERKLLTHPKQHPKQEVKQNFDDTV